MSRLRAHDLENTVALRGCEIIAKIDTFPLRSRYRRKFRRYPQMSVST